MARPFDLPASAPEERLLRTCVRCFLQHGVDDSGAQHVSPAVNWDNVCSWASTQGIGPLVYHCLHGGLVHPPQNMTLEALEPLRAEVLRNVVTKTRAAASIARALRFFGELGIDMLLIKGASLDYFVYERPWYTVSADIDVVFRPKRADLPEPARAAVDTYLGQWAEVEYGYFRHHDVDMNGVLPIDFAGIWERAARVTLDGEAVAIMSPEDMLVCACIASARKRFFRLKTICDLGAIVRRFPAMDWRVVACRAASYDCAGIVYAAMLIASAITGCTGPSGWLETLRVGKLKALTIRQAARSISRTRSARLQDRRQFFGKQFDRSVMLPYLCLRPAHVFAHVPIVYDQMRPNGIGKIRLTRARGP